MDNKDHEDPVLASVGQAGQPDHRGEPVDLTNRPDQGDVPAQLWPCGCLPNSQGAHRKPCRVASEPAEPGGRRVHPGEIDEIERRAQLGQMIHPGDVLALVRTVHSLSHRVVVRFDETAKALRRASDAEQAVTGLAPAGLLQQAQRAEQQVADLQAQVVKRYTAEQVGDLQTSEAELVSAPLQARLAAAEKDLCLEEDRHTRTIDKLREEQRRHQDTLQELQRFRDTWSDSEQAALMQRADKAEREQRLQETLVVQLRRELTQARRTIVTGSTQHNIDIEILHKTIRERDGQIKELQAERVALRNRGEAMAAEVSRTHAGRKGAEERLGQAMRSLQDCQARLKRSQAQLSAIDRAVSEAMFTDEVTHAVQVMASVSGPTGQLVTAVRAVRLVMGRLHLPAAAWPAAADAALPGPNQPQPE